MNLPTFLQLAFELIGGLGIFLLGMKNMSDGMQSVAGNSLRRLISTVTGNRLFAITMGTLVTFFVQSSSITTVMVVGFVNSGVMSLMQAVGVIMGANIGTTITGWILVLKVGKYGLPLLGAAAFVFLFSRGDRWRYWAMAIMGVGMVFFGLEIMKDACSIIKENPAFEDWFHKFQADSYLGVLKCALVGCLLTTMVQSSSATLAITVSLASQGVISYETAAALILGENIGTTITAFLASLGATTNARRAAYFHVLFNIIGVFWITLVFSWYIEFVQWIVEWFLDVKISAPTMVDGVETFPNTTPAIATTHSMFNIANTILFFPFVPMIVRMLERWVPSKEFKEKPHLTDLDMRMLDTPALAIEQSRVELERMGDGCEKMMRWLVELRDQDDPDKQLANRLKRREQVLDSIQDEIAVYITNLLSGNVPHTVADEARQQLRMADEFESVSDYIADLDKFDRKLRRDGHRFSPDQRAALNDLNRELLEQLIAINGALKVGNKNILVETAAAAKRIRNHIKQMRAKHLEALSHGGVPPLVNVAYLASLNAYARVLDYEQNIAEAVSGDK
ncbi:Na/Pi cotransporter family protein [Aeoliella sp.]|uniref:Na/Pi cotransporter family protein n=1 Tax=Aeoliella sp. TaxID=2795800 RepID=UPI003CCBDA32